MNELLSNEKLRKEVEYCVTMEYKAPQGEPAASRIDRLMRIFDAQKRLYAESVLDEVLVAIDKNIEASKGNLKYARDHNNSDRTIANWKGCVEGEKFIKDDVTRLRAEQRAR